MESPERAANPLPFLIRRAWTYAGRHRPLMVLYFLMFLGAQAISLTEPYVLGGLINAVQQERNPDRLLSVILVSCGLYLLIQVAFWTLHGPARTIERHVAFWVRLRFKGDLFRKVGELPLQWHRDTHSGETIDKVNRAATALFDFCAGSFMVIYMLLRLVGAHAILLWFFPFAGAIAMATSLAVVSMIFLYDRVLYRQYKALNVFENRVASALQDYMTNMITVVTLRLQRRVEGEVDHRMQAGLPLFDRSAVLNELKWFSTNFLIAVMITVVLSYYAWSRLTAGQAILAGTLFTLFEYLRRIGDCFYNFAMLYGGLVRQSADLRGVHALEESHRSLAQRRARATLPPDWKTIRVTGLSFTYQDARSDERHLDGVDLDLARGSAIALVGPSGCGKSTLLTLLRGLQEPRSAAVSCDGAPLGDGLAHLAGSTTLLPQDPELFSDTILFNTTFGVEADESQVREALDTARFTPVLERLPRGVETSIAEKGVNLSGGEKQRLALARGVFFARDAEIVLLDEPTSSVDTVNERLIYASLLRLFRDRCLVSAVHKLHLLPLFDRIHVLDGGRVVERGTFDELIVRGGTLARLWAAYQASHSDECEERPGASASRTETRPVTIAAGPPSA